MSQTIPGYTSGTPAVARSPLSLAELELIKKTVLFGDDDVRYLRMSREVLADQIEQILDVWYGFVGANPHLLASFSHRDSGEPLGPYLQAVRRRFGSMDGSTRFTTITRSAHSSRATSMGMFRTRPPSLRM